MTEKETFTFPPFHERAVPLTDADNLRIELTQATRELIRESFVSTASDEDMQAAVDAVRAATEAVARATGRDVGAFNSNFMDRSPFMGLMNPLAPPMEARLDRDHGEHGAVIGTVTFREPHEGPPGHVHGGFLAAVFDEVLGQAQSLSGRPGMTGKLSISYRSPTPLFRELTVRGWIDRIDGRKIFTRGTLHDGDTLCCESEGLFISMPTDLLHLLRKGRDTVDSTVPPEFRSRMAGENSQQ
ncbi:MAG: PaaI family thioesterase [Ilumatobacteraceae bacterium]